MRPAIPLLVLILLGCRGDEPVRFDRRPPYDSRVAWRVDPFIGTAGEGFTFPGAVAPWGMVSVSPHNIYTSPKDVILAGRIAPSGYLHGEPRIFDLGLTQLSGVGCPDLGAPTLMATTGPVDPAPEQRASAYEDEAAWPGYYTARLVNWDIRVEATATPRVGVLRLRFPAGSAGNVLVDAGKTLSWLDGSNHVRVVSPREVEGWTETGLFCVRPNRQRVHFVARFDRAATETGTWKDGAGGSAATRDGRDVGAFLRFDPAAGREVEVRVGLSYVDLAGARRNLERELPAGQGFEEARAKTFAAWDTALSRLRVSGGTDAEQTIFYTALYHALLHPNVLSDVDGRYPPMGGGVATSAGGPRYTVFSLWDTYRTLHPLLTLVFPERQREMLRSLAAMARESGRPPKWELIGQEVNMMVGDPLALVVADGHVKGLGGIDLEGLYPILRDAALETAEPEHRPGNAVYRELGYLPMEQAKQVWGPVSTTLEYALADWALSRLARGLGHEADAHRFERQARSYARLFDKQTGMLRPRNADGSWYAPFDPTAMEGSAPQPRSGGPGYVEGNAWHYAFSVPHDVAGLAALHGGAGAFVSRLQQLFDRDQLTLWNEPDIAFPYLFTHFPGEAWRTQREVHRARQRFFGAGPDGLPGNDDAGTLSAWYVFSAMGLYPDCPGSTRYSLTSPLFDRVEIALPSTTTFVIEAPRAAPDAIYIRSMTLGGKPHAEPYLTHTRILAGGTLRLELGESPAR